MRTFFVTALIAGLLSCATGVGRAEAQPNLPNIVVFLVDDLGVMDTSVPMLTDERGRPLRYPLNDFYRTPNMERLAAQGIRFSNFYAMSVCSPTRVSLLTGQNSARHHTTNWINPDQNNHGPAGPIDWDWQGLDSRDVTLPHLLQDAGYRTIHVGKGHLGPRGSEGADPSNLGFAVNIGGASIGAPGSYYGRENYRRRQDDRATVPHLEAYHGTDTFLSEALTREAIHHVRAAASADQPFFLYFAHYAVHAPFNSDPRFAAHYERSEKPEAAQAFATLVEGMDKSLGDLLDQLHSLGVAENTLVLFVGDNGTDAPLGHEHAVACAAPLRGRKGSHYEGGMRVPLIAAWAKPDRANPWQQRLPIAAGAIQPQQAAVYDLFPTILALVDRTAPAEHVVDGARLDTLLTGEQDSERSEVFLMHYPHGPHRSDYFTCYREGNWKVIYHYIPSAASENSHYQLYDLASDPFESTNLAAAKPDQLRHMMQRLANALEQQHAQYPISPEAAQPLLPQLPQ